MVLPSNYLTKASAYSARHFGFRARVVYQEFVPNTLIFTIRGTGFYDGSNGSMLEHLDTDDVADGINSRLTIDAVLDNWVVYERLPSKLAVQLPGDRPWVSLDLGDLFKLEGLSGALTYLRNEQQLMLPGQYLSYLRATSRGTLVDMGSVKVDGVMAEHYHADLDIEKLPRVVPARARAATAQFVSELRHKIGHWLLPIDVWVDPNGFVRRIVSYEPAKFDGALATLITQVDYSHYGHGHEPVPPPSYDTTDLLSLLR